MKFRNDAWSIMLSKLLIELKHSKDTPTRIRIGSISKFIWGENIIDSWPTNIYKIQRKKN